MSEEDGALLQKMRKTSIETAVQHLVELKNENGRVTKNTYKKVLESLASIGVVIDS